MPEEKRQRILTAAFEEFAAHGYTRASTNRIVCRAEISKGTLFYYFNSKNELFNDLVEIALNLVLERFFPIIEADSNDYFDRLNSLAKVKLLFQHQRPEVLHFISSLFTSGDAAHLTSEVKSRYERVVADARLQVRKPTDMSLFRRDIPEDILRDLLIWITEGYERRLIAGLETDKNFLSEENFQRKWEEYNRFLEILKRIFYEEDNHI